MTAAKVLFEIKTGDATNTKNQLAVYPQIIDGNAFPSEPMRPNMA